MSVVVRFAPSPTGYLHIGGARTALFNWLFARHHQGRFLLRIEDTDQERSTESAKQAILDGLKWLELGWDGDVVYQAQRGARHAEVAHQLLASGHAYHCYCTPEELEAMREQAAKDGKPFRYSGLWRDRDTAEAPQGVKPAIRLKAPREGKVVLPDLVQGDVVVEAEQLDDMVLLRSDGTATYMLAVVVDDHDMGITHIIRGDDHLTNASRQMLIYQAMGWDVPQMAHIPLIHGPDGAKLSKRHGALGVEAYRDMGYLPEAMRNYLLRLGWSHGDAEIISTDEAVAWFDLGAVGKSPSRLDFAKLDHTNAHYIKHAANPRLVALIAPLLEAKLGRPLSELEHKRLECAMEGLKPRAKTLVELADAAWFYVAPRPIALEEKARPLIEGDGKTLLLSLVSALDGLSEWNHDTLQEAAKSVAAQTGKKLGDVMGPVRAAITGKTASPSMFEAMELLGKDESLERLRDVC